MKAGDKMHLTGFMLFCPAPHMIMSSVYPEEKMNSGRYFDIEYWAGIARTLERGKFDMFFFADGWAGGTNPPSVKYAIQFPTQDPTVLVPYLCAVAPKLSYAVTMSTTFHEPYMLARKLATLDHITKGRIGWNIVSSIWSGEARTSARKSCRPTTSVVIAPTSSSRSAKSSGAVGSRRPADGHGADDLRRPVQDPQNQPCREVVQGPGSADRAPLAPTPSPPVPGGGVGPGPRLRRPARRMHLRDRRGGQADA